MACRASRAGHVPDSRLAAANASVMRAAARSFIRGSSDDVTSGWGAHRGHVAALLCFDEMQVSASRPIQEAPSAAHHTHHTWLVCSN